MAATRKKTKLSHSIKIDNQDEKLVFVNDKLLDLIKKDSLEFKPLTEILRFLPNGHYFFKTFGGGVGSLQEVIAKELYQYLPINEKQIIKTKYPTLSKTDIRRVQPKKVGGKARAKYQKSYR